MGQKHWPKRQDQLTPNRIEIPTASTIPNSHPYNQNNPVVTLNTPSNTPVHIAAAVALAVNSHNARNVVTKTKPMPVKVPRTATTSVMARVHKTLATRGTEKEQRGNKRRKHCQGKEKEQRRNKYAKEKEKRKKREGTEKETLPKADPKKMVRNVLLVPITATCTQ